MPDGSSPPKRTALFALRGDYASSTIHHSVKLRQRCSRANRTTHRLPTTPSS